MYNPVSASFTILFKDSLAPSKELIILPICLVLVTPNTAVFQAKVALPAFSDILFFSSSDILGCSKVSLLYTSFLLPIASDDASPKEANEVLAYPCIAVLCLLACPALCSASKISLVWFLLLAIAAIASSAVAYLPAATRSSATDPIILLGIAEDINPPVTAPAATVPIANPAFFNTPSAQKLAVPNLLPSPIACSSLVFRLGKLCISSRDSVQLVVALFIELFQKSENSCSPSSPPVTRSATPRAVPRVPLIKVAPAIPPILTVAFFHLSPVVCCLALYSARSPNWS